MSLKGPLHTHRRQGSVDPGQKALPRPAPSEDGRPSITSSASTRAPPGCAGARRPMVDPADRIPAVRNFAQPQSGSRHHPPSHSCLTTCVQALVVCCRSCISAWASLVLSVSALLCWSIVGLAEMPRPSRPTQRPQQPWHSGQASSQTDRRATDPLALSPPPTGCPLGNRVLISAVPSPTLPLRGLPSHA